MSGRKRGAILISGGGSNMVALLEAARDPSFPVEFVAVVSDKANAGGLAKAEALGVKATVFERRTYGSKADHEQAILDHLAAEGVEFLCLAGYMRLVSGSFIRPFEGRIINIHPSLLPLFPGLHTHQRAIDAGMKVSGCTVHHVTEGMDEGPVIAQAVVPVLTGDTAEALAARVLTAEHKLYRTAVTRLFGAGTATDDRQMLISLG
ncbi:phosphoribosylglycinamide formyltransferase [Rhizobium alvei]|uniref:Phosphoribosylglycinamide formyltransferase n=1 Tax=Rhizobium alvei TaxID=1132659 RepID=A0ABT8YKE9_9HYPH|nr:phosphoribosylglycinamide formyltransferase [Rhizobium alvei]MDO6963730.1 phosphoribosylglycinamide formyltransferase [Rhizobium alvei]